jgi:hypothetical protein
MIGDTFKTCSDVTVRAQVDELIDDVEGGFGSMAMVDYPYAAGFLGSLPAYPVKVVCDSISSMTPMSDEDHLKVLALSN